MRKPNFFIVGAPRSATTSLYLGLKQHPQIYLSVQKEPHFFGSDLTPMPGTIREEPLYLALFAGAGDRPRVGEGSVWYLSSRRAPAEIKTCCPDAKILILLRDPVPMTRSLYELYRRTGNEDLPTLEAALDAEPERRLGRRIPPGAYFPEGLLYTEVASNAAKVERWFEVFGRGEVLCLLFDDFVRDGAAVYRQTLEFLGVDPDFQAELDPQRARLRVRAQAIRQLRELPAEVRSRVQMEQIRQHESGSRLPPLPADLAARLRGIFAGEVARLGALLGRDLAAWTERKQPVRSDGKGASPASPEGSGGARLREVLEMVRVLKRIPPEIRARHERVETLERKFARWQRVRIPELPLVQRPYHDAWPSWFADERERIAGALGPRAVMIEHFGSTAIPGLSSKNIVDIAVAVDGPADPAVRLAGVGYESYGNSPIDPETTWLWKVEEDRAFVIHVCERRRSWLDEQMDLRDYLRAHAEEKDRYAQLKRRLAEETDQSFLQYTVSKVSLSIEMIDRAREWKAGLASA
jgi:GrpB-like predicted nucleotidyltransferase (UPF0157 family)